MVDRARHRFGESSGSWIVAGAAKGSGKKYTHRPLSVSVFLSGFLLPVFVQISSSGILPAVDVMSDMYRLYGFSWKGFSKCPTVFWWGASDRAIVVTNILGVVCHCGYVMNDQN